MDDDNGATVDGLGRARSLPRMFMIIGGDGKEYGPVTVQQVRTWMEAGRANLDTKAKALGTDEWRRLGDYAEFAGPAAPPPLLEGVAPAAAPGGAFSAPVGGGGFTAPLTVEPELAGIAARTIAALVNGFFYFLSMMPGSTVMARGLLEKNPQLSKGGIPRIEDLDLTGFAEGMIWIWAGLTAVLLLQALLITVRGQNLGKLLTGAKVVRADTGAPAGFGRGVMLRFAMPVGLIIALNAFFMLGLVFLIVDYAFMFRADRRCLHDLMAGTKVVRA